MDILKLFLDLSLLYKLTDPIPGEKKYWGLCQMVDIKITPGNVLCNWVDQKWFFKNESPFIPFCEVCAQQSILV